MTAAQRPGILRGMPSQPTSIPDALPRAPSQAAWDAMTPAAREAEEAARKEAEHRLALALAELAQLRLANPKT